MRASTDSRPRLRLVLAAAIVLAGLTASAAGSAAATPGPRAGAPETSITSAPESPTYETSARFRFTSRGGGPDVAYQCRVDRGRWRACASPTGRIRLGHGSHLFEVRALAAGVAD